MGEAGRPHGEPADLFHRLRDALLAGTAASHGLEPTGRVWAVLMEVGYPEGTASVAMRADGEASVLFSHGGAMLGGGQHESVRLRAQAIVREADRFLHLAKPAAEQPLPVPGGVSTYFLTDGEILVVETSQDALERGQHGLSPLLHAGQTVITEVIRIARAQGRGEEPD